MRFSSPWVRSAKDGSSKRSRPTRETHQEQEARLEHARTRKIRKLSAWNVFQRQGTEGLTLSKPEYTAKVKELSKQWRRMTFDEKAPFQAEAEHQQLVLDQLAATPLATKSGKRPDSAEEEAKEAGLDLQAAWKNASKKLSCRRLELNKEAFSKHAVWSSPTQLGDCTLEQESRALLLSSSLTSGTGHVQCFVMFLFSFSSFF